ncbi:MAG: DNA repair protein RecN [Henriciella sp.]|jgi:DNA repair protein RecN (Recombination protein N)
MIVALSIRSFVLIDSLDLEAQTGFTALTGETGAGKSIILDALGLALGGPANRKQVRTGADRASISVEFELNQDHAVWALLRHHDIEVSNEDTLILRRIIQRSGPSRAFLNEQPVSTALLSEIGAVLVEIHGQHAASGLMRPSSHRAMLDSFGGHTEDVKACASLWHAFEAARDHRQALEAAAKSAHERRDWLSFAVEDLSKLAPEAGECEALVAQRGVLLQSERITETIEEAHDALRDKALDESLSKAARATDRILHIRGLEALDANILVAAKQAAEAVERTLIELAEAQEAVRGLLQFGGHDSNSLESAEGRLFALRAAARKYDCTPELLAEVLERHCADLALCNSDTKALEYAKQAETAARAAWAEVAQKLTEVRYKTAARLETTIMRELKPLHLGRVQVQVGFIPISEDESGAKGLERVEFQVETNPGAGFGPLKAIASGGELARFSLAFKCALSTAGGAGTLIFDEADQGVGGAVAAAIGERLGGLAKARQVFAITHSPQVASSAQRQWRVMKAPTQKGQLITHVAQLDDGQRLEEIARMLSGSSITDEARAAASKLLEAA